MLTVTVRGTTPAGQVALWDTTQPAGEVFLVSGETAQVALTSAVNLALSRGFLAIVEEPPPAPAPEIAQPEPSKPATKRGRP